MKKYYLILLLAGLSFAAMAQSPPAKKEQVDSVSITIAKQDRDVLNQWLKNAYDIIGNSNAPKKEADLVQKQLQTISAVFTNLAKPVLIVKDKAKEIVKQPPEKPKQ